MPVPQQTEETPKTIAPYQGIVGKDVVPMGALGGQVASGFLWVLGVLFVGIAIAQRFRKKGKDQKAQVIHVESRLSVGPRTALLVAEVDGQRFLLGQTTEQLSFLTHLPSVDELHGGVDDIESPGDGAPKQEAIANL